jgi:hypothetical protein
MRRSLASDRQVRPPLRFHHRISEAIGPIADQVPALCAGVYLLGTLALVNSQPGHGVVGPGWRQLRVSNCPFVTRPAV